MACGFSLYSEAKFLVTDWGYSRQLYAIVDYIPPSGTNNEEEEEEEEFGYRYGYICFLSRKFARHSYSIVCTKTKKAHSILNGNLYDLPKDICTRAVVQIEVGNQTSFRYLASSPSPTHFVQTFKTSFFNTVIYVPIGKYYRCAGIIYKGPFMQSLKMVFSLGFDNFTGSREQRLSYVSIYCKGGGAGGGGLEHYASL